VIVERRLIGFGACAFLLAGAGTLFFWPVLIDGRVPVFRDILDSTLPFGRYVGERLREGKLPQWFPYEGLGEPFIGQLNDNTFHPSSWLYAVLPLAAALRWQMLLGYLAAGFGQLLFARKLGMSFTASALAAVAFVFSGYALSLSNNLPYLWGLGTLPWVGLFAAEVQTRERPWPWVSALALSWAAIVVSGDSHSALFGGLVALFAALQTRRLRRLPLCVLASLIAIGVAGAELLPALDIVREGPRAGSLNVNWLSTFWSLHPYRLPELVLPGWLPPKTTTLISNARYDEGGVWAVSIYAGMPVVALALMGIFSRTRQGLLSGALALLGLWMATGRGGGLLPLVHRLPVLGVLKFPEKYLGLWTLGLPLAAAAGLDWWREKPGRRIPAALAAATIAFAAAAYLLPADAALRIWPQLRDRPPHVEKLHQAWQAALLAAALALLGTSLILAGSRRRPGLLALLPVLAFADFWVANGSIIGVADPRLLTETPRFCAAARREGAGPAGLRAVNISNRIRRVEEMDHPEVWAGNTLNQLQPATTSLCQIGSIWREGILSNEPRWVRWAIGSDHLERSQPLVLFGFGIAVRAPGDPPIKDETVVDALELAQGEGLVLVRRPAAPRAWAAVPRWVPDGRTALREANEHGLELVESPVLAGSGPPFTGTGSAGTVRIAAYQPEHVVLEAQMAKPGAVILNDLASRGWTATVDGAPAQLYRANVLARGVLVPEGSHRVEMRYQLPRLRAGLALSGASLLLCISLLIFGRWRRGTISAAPPGAGQAT
jgi:hypothetical protein